MPRRKKLSTAPNQGDDVTYVKNGWLALAVLGSILIMLSLVGLDIYLLRHPAVSSKLFGKGDVGKLPQGSGHEMRTSNDSKKQTCPSAPEMTFYTRLAGTSDSGSHPTTMGDSVADASVHTYEVTNGSKVGVTGNDTPTSLDAKLSTNLGGQSHISERALPAPQNGSPIYTVQVGAFTQPGIAQEWAAKWKARGYEVALKPVARPKTGIIYRLYLGSFSNEKSAEELVKHLKTKEGISAFTLVLRN